MSEQPLWERRFRAPTRTLPAWGPAAPDRFVLLSDEQGSFQAYAWEPGSDPARRTDEPVGVSLATVSADGSSVVWFSDPTGDESGRWLAVPFEGGDPVELFPGAPVGWPEGLSLGRELAVAVLADRDGFAVYVSEDGGAAKEIHRHPDLIGISDSELHVEGFDHVGLSADETLVCLEVAQDGDNIRRKLLVLDPRTGAVVGELADGPGLGVRAFAWSPVLGDQRHVQTYVTPADGAATGDLFQNLGNLFVGDVGIPGSGGSEKLLDPRQRAGHDQSCRCGGERSKKCSAG